MSLGIVLAASAGLLFGVLSLAYKYAERVKARPAQFTFVLSVVAGIETLLKSFTEQSTWSEPLLWIAGAVMGTVIVAGIYIIMAANTLGPVYTAWTMVNVSFLFAIFLSVLTLGERLLCVDPINLLLFGLTLYLFLRGMRHGDHVKLTRESLLHLLALVGVFVTNGLVTYGSKIKYAFFGEANTSAYATVFYFVSALITLFIILTNRKGKFLTKDELKSGALAGICMSTATILFLSAMALPVAAVFTITQGMSLTSGVALTTLVGKERLNAWMVLGVISGAILLLAVIFREQTAAWLCG